MSYFWEYRRLVGASRIVLGPMIILMLFVGLYQKGFSSANTVHWQADGVGLAFDGSSIGYTSRKFSIPGAENGFSIDLTFEPQYQLRLSFQVIMVLYGDDDESQLLVGQWDKSLVVMNGSDYSNKYRKPKLYVPLGEKAGKQQVRIITGTEGTAVYINGVLARKNRAFTLKLPPTSQSRLILGNSVVIRNGWHGIFYNLSFVAGGSGGGKIEYFFQKSGEDCVAELGKNGPAILLPGHIPVMKKKILVWPDFATVNPVLLFIDIVINILGFIPLGVVFPLFLESSGAKNFSGAMLASAILIPCFSLTIEIAQVWIPSRHSSSLDLILNTLGGMIGILASYQIRKRISAC